MRITNTMSTSRLMLNVNRNRTMLDKYYTQMSTGKKIQYASEDPITASRTLRFRTAVSETEQYAKNVQQGYSWMEISESAISNSEDMLQKMRALLVQGSTGSLTDSDRQNVIQEIKGLIDEVGNQMNQTYAGRYVFSGYRTDEPAVFNEGNSEKFKITQDFDYTNIEDFKAYSKPNKDIPADVFDAKRIKLPYTNIDDNTITISTGATVTAKTSSEADAYKPEPGEAIYLKDTGELILSDELAKKISDEDKFDEASDTGGISITYEKTGFAVNDLNPKVYFDCEELDVNGDVKLDANGEPLEYNMDNQNMQYEFSVGVKVDVNNLAKDMFTPEMRADFMEFYSFVDSLTVSDEVDIKKRLEDEGLSGTELEEAVAAQLAEETQKSRAVDQSRFEQMIKKIDKHMTQMSKERTDMGSRMSRLEMMGNRLSDDTLSYTSLLTKTEEADLFEVVTNLNAMDAMYQASLKTGMMMIRTSLADFI